MILRPFTCIEGGLLLRIKLSLSAQYFSTCSFAHILLFPIDVNHFRTTIMGSIGQPTEAPLNRAEEVDEVSHAAALHFILSASDTELFGNIADHLHYTLKVPLL